MTDLIYDFISTGVDLILVGSVLAAMIVMMRGSANLTTLISHQQVVTEEFDYYLKYHMYDNQEGLSAADALSAMVGNRFDLHVCIYDPATKKSYMNNPGDGKYYEVADTFFNANNTDTDGKMTTSEAAALCLPTKRLDYKQLAATNELAPDKKYKVSVVGLEDGVLKKVNFSRDTIVVGIYFEVMP
jgi:hypothetical protein